MKRFKYSLLINSSILVLSVIILISCWSVNVSFIPSMCIASILCIVCVIKKKLVYITTNGLFISLLLCYELTNYYFSSYKFNTLLFIFEIVVVLVCSLLICYLVHKEKYREYFVFFMSFFAGIIALLNIPMFFFRFYEFSFWGFNDFTQFRALYNPMGLLSNEWVTMMIVLLPFPVIAFFMSIIKCKQSDFSNNFSIIKYLLVFIILIIVFNVLISFSRAGYLSLLMFFLSLDVLLFVNKCFSVKKILCSNIILIMLISLFCIAFNSSVHSTIYSTDSHKRSTIGRIEQWKTAGSIIKAYPFWGVGSKNYALISSTFQEEKMDAAFSARINNSYLQLLIEKGLVGFLIWGGCFCYLLYKIIKVKNSKGEIDTLIRIITISGIAAVLIREMFFSSILYNSGILLFFLILMLLNNFKDTKVCIVCISRTLIFTAFILISLFSIFIYISYENDIALYEDYITKIEDECNFENPIYSVSNGNSLFDAVGGLAIERMNFKMNFRNIIIKKEFNKMDFENIGKAIECYKKASELNPFDGMLQHNIGWLYYMHGLPEIALRHISNAIELSPNTALFHISRGIMFEELELDNALNDYQLAIMLSPDICDSYFFYDLKMRYPQETKHLLENAYNKLGNIQIRSYSSVIEAKMGKILFVLNEIDKAYQALLDVSKIYPSLNRPWYYLGRIEIINGKRDDASTYFTKAIFLDNSDYLAIYGMVEYYTGLHSNSQKEIYSKLANEKWKKKKSSSAICAKRIYYLNTVNDDVIPNGLLNYISPVYKIE